MRALRLMRWIAFAGIALFLAAIVVFEFAPGVREFALSPSGGAVIKPRSLKGARAGIAFDAHEGPQWVAFGRMPGGWRMPAPGASRPLPGVPAKVS
jgi:hypothetical protein